MAVNNLLVLLMAVFCVMTVDAQYKVKNPQISAVLPSGIKFSYPKDDAGLSEVSYHYNINQPLAGVAAGTYNVDVNTLTDGAFVHTNPSVTLKAGDKVYYWVHCLVTGGGHILTDQVWTYDGGVTTSTTPSTTKTTTTKTTTTKQPTTPYTGPTTEKPNCPDCDCEGRGQTKKCTRYPCLIFEDEFDTLDMAVWEHEITAGGGGNWEFQYYSNNRSNSYVKDGVLHIKPTLTEEKYGSITQSGTVLELWGSEPANLCTGNAWYGCRRETGGPNIINPIQSARLRTVKSMAFRYGSLEIEAKMPKGDWIWPAIWLLPKYQAYGIWPASGEIDLLESRGNENLVGPDGTPIGTSQIGSTMHYGPYWPENGWAFAHADKNLKGTTFADGFHKFRLDWDADGLGFFVDDEQILYVATDDGYWKRGKFDGRLKDESNPWKYGGQDAPFDQEFYIIFNVAVGGTGGYFADSQRNSPYSKPWTDTSSQAALDFWNAKGQWYPTWPKGNNEDDRAMQINYIRIWKMKEEDDQPVF